MVRSAEFIAGVREGRKSERERIIHLLARIYPNVDWDLTLQPHIKGENKND